MLARLEAERDRAAPLLGRPSLNLGFALPLEFIPGIRVVTQVKKSAWEMGERAQVFPILHPPYLTQNSLPKPPR